MLVAAFSWGDLWRLALAVFLLAVGLSSAYLLVRLGGTVGRLSAFISGAEREILPVINKVGGSVDRINVQLDKVDQITDSAVDAADSADTAVRAVSMAVTRPVQKVSGLAAALSYGVSDFKAKRDWKHAVQAGKEAAARREQEILARLDDKILLRKYNDDGDIQAREKLIEQYMALVRSLARRYSYRGEQLEDLVQIGAIGLIKAIDRFDLDRGVELTTYATPNIIGEIKRHFRDRGWSVRVPRGLQELNIQLSRLIEELTVQFSRSPTIAELAKGAGVTDEEVLEALESGRAYSSLSLSVGASQD